MLLYWFNVLLSIVEARSESLLTYPPNTFLCPGSAAWLPHPSCHYELGKGGSCKEVRQEALNRVKGLHGWVDPRSKLDGGWYEVETDTETESASLTYNPDAPVESDSDRLSDSDSEVVAPLHLKRIIPGPGPTSSKTINSNSTVPPGPRTDRLILTPGPRTDRLILTFRKDGHIAPTGHCYVHACSESQSHYTLHDLFTDPSTNWCNLFMLLCGGESERLEMDRCPVSSGDYETEGAVIWGDCRTSPLAEARKRCLDVDTVGQVEGTRRSSSENDSEKRRSDQNHQDENVTVYI